MDRLRSGGRALLEALSTHGRVNWRKVPEIPSTSGSLRFCARQWAKQPLIS
jgi:hypothetical protein